MASQQLNLIPSDVLFRMEIQRRVRRWTRSAAGIVLLVLASRIAIERALAHDRVQLREAEARAEAQRQASLALDGVRDERDRLADMLLERNAVLPQSSLLGLFQALETAMPPDLYLRTLTAEPAEGATSPTLFDVRLEGMAPTTDAVASFLFRLAGRTDMTSTELEFSRRDEASPSSAVRFAVKTRYHLPDPAS